MSVRAAFNLVGTVLVLVALVGVHMAAAQSTPALTGRVVDDASVLSPPGEQELADLLERHEAATSNQVVVLTITGLEGESIEEYALRVARSWGLGTAERDNGVLILVAVQLEP